MKDRQRVLLMAIASVAIAVPLLAQTARARTEGSGAQGRRGQTEQGASVADRERDRQAQGTSLPTPSTGSRGIQSPTEGVNTGRANSQAQASQAEMLSSVVTAVEREGFVQTDDEFILKKPVDLSSSQNFKTVDFQVGTIDGKPAYIPVEVPRSNNGSENDIKALLQTIQFHVPTLQMCTVDTELVCVQTRDGECIRYECVKKK